MSIVAYDNRPVVFVDNSDAIKALTSGGPIVIAKGPGADVPLTHNNVECIVGVKVYKGISEQPAFEMNTEMGVSYLMGKNIEGESQLCEMIAAFPGTQDGELQIFVAYDAQPDEETLIHMVGRSIQALAAIKGQDFIKEFTRPSEIQIHTIPTEGIPALGFLQNIR